MHQTLLMDSNELCFLRPSEHDNAIYNPSKPSSNAKFIVGQVCVSWTNHLKFYNVYEISKCYKKVHGIGWIIERFNNRLLFPNKKT